MARPIRWLHLSDLHYGCPGKELWEQVELEFFRDLDVQLDRLGPPDLLLFTGDLAYSGAKNEYARVDAFLDELRGHLTRSGAAEPLLLAVPGNHDVARPAGRTALLYRILRSFDGTVDDPEVAAIHEELWKQQDASFIDGLFPGYRLWFERRVRPQLEARAKTVHFSHFPCDFTAVVEPEGTFPLTLVGLNSTWLQYSGDDFEGKLLVPIDQLRAALGPAGKRKRYAVVDSGGPSLLLMHQPPEWLSENGKSAFDADIYPGGRFSLCLYGHMHEAESRWTAAYGGQGRCFFQAPSLFGLEKWGRSDEDRRMGYSFGQIGEDEEIRVWPREGKSRGDGRRSFGFDGRFHAERGGRDPDSVVIRHATPRSESRVAPERSDETSKSASAEIEAYLKALRSSVRHLELQGLTVDDQHRAVHPLLTQLYTPIRGRDEGDLHAVMAGSLTRGRQERPPLEELLLRGSRILIEGPPGCGKSTFLRYVTSLLVAPALGEHVDEAHSRSARRLRIGTPIPVLLRLEGLGRALAAEEKPDDRERLLDLLNVECRSRKVGFDRQAWRVRLEDGRACLLLDGLDEVAVVANLRTRVLAVLGDAARHWEARLLVASRPFLTEGLQDAGFLKLEVAAFDDDDVRCFLDKWVAMLNEEDLESAKTAAARKYRRKLEGAILRPDVRQLAKSPMMLTCLCLVHWSRGELPQGRARVYQAVLKWLLEARRERRLALFRLPEAGAYEALADLALWAMTREDGKQVTLELDAAAAEVAPAFERIRPELDPAGRQEEGRRWLVFEAESSGIVEELPGDRLRFWHLTFQEYLAGWRLAQLPAGEDWWPRIEPHLDDSQWRETVELFASCLKLHRHTSHVDRLLKRVLDQRSDGSDLARDARVVAILGRLLPALEIYDYSPTTTVRSVHADLSREVMAIFDPEGAAQVPIAERIAAAEALGRGGDPRLRPELDNFLPVPGAAIQLGKYPVTVEEFRRFVDARGYEDGRWWQEGWPVKKEAGWNSPDSWGEQLLTPNRPVVSVSWWEATAYCRWLSEQRGMDIRLPTQAEWQAAAIHPEGGEYPWGPAEPDEERANFAREPGRGNVGRPTPVGVYPHGAGAFGHLDLGGNVWEWCLDELEDGRFRPLRGGSWRGGSWWNVASDLRSAHWNRLEPDGRGGLFGFRVSFAPSSTAP